MGLPPSRCSSLFLLVWIFGLCVSCTPVDRTDAIFENYLYRMSNVFQFDHVTLTELPGESFPPRRRLQFQLPQQSINLLEFLRLSRCELQRLLGARNSSLGITMANSQRWLYELSFIELAQQCLQTLANNSDAADLRQQLKLVLAQKHRSLEEVYWNALWGSEEFQHVFSVGVMPVTQQQLTSRPILLEQAMVELFAGVEYWQSMDDALRRSKFESQLAVLESAKYLGQLRVSMNLAQGYLQAIEKAVVGGENVNPLCGSIRVSERAEVMERVFLRYYIGEVQPILSGLHQRIEQMRKVLIAAPATELFRTADTDNGRSAESALGESLQEQVLISYWQAVWADTGHSEWGRYRQSVNSHTQMWQDILSRCGRMPH